MRFQEIQDHLNEHQQLIEYSLAEGFAIILSVQKGSANIFRRDLNEGFWKSFDHVNSTLSTPNPGFSKDKVQEYEKAATSLYSILLDGIAQEGNELIIVPDKDLSFLSFEALVKIILCL